MIFISLCNIRTSNTWFSWQRTFWSHLFDCCHVNPSLISSEVDHKCITVATSRRVILLTAHFS